MFFAGERRLELRFCISQQDWLKSYKSQALRAEAAWICGEMHNSYLAAANQRVEKLSQHHVKCIRPLHRRDVRGVG